MAIRQALNERPALVVGGSFLLILAAAIYWGSRQLGSHQPPARPGDDIAFYSDDEGHSFFIDDTKRLTPFPHDGKQAVRAYVFRCGHFRFVGYLQRHTEYGRQQKSALQIADRPTFASPALYEVKKPGDANWLPADPKHFNDVLKLMAVKCPSGSPDEEPTAVYPGVP